MNGSRNLNVFVADDSMVLRERMLEMLREIPGIKVVGCADNGIHAIDCIRQLRPDAVVLDIQMPRGTGLDVLKQIKQGGDTPLVIIFTNFPYAQYRKRALEYGAQFFFDKSAEFENLRNLFERLTGNVIKLQPMRSTEGRPDYAK